MSLVKRKKASRPHHSEPAEAVNPKPSTESLVTRKPRAELGLPDDIDPEVSRKPKKRKRWWLRAILIVLGLAVLGGAALGAKVYLSLHKVVQQHTGVSAPALAEAVTPQLLKGEGDGRVNVLLLGEGDQGHAGEGLTDTIMVASYDVKNNQLAMLSLPRDLYVRIQGVGWDKINAAHVYGEQAKEGSGPELVKQTVTDILDVPIHYYALVNFSGLKQAVDAVGGVDAIDNKEVLDDPEYPCDKNENRSCGFHLDPGVYHMDGTMALKFARCRKGTCGDDYGRAGRQQQILLGLRQKALQQSVLGNPAKILELLGVVGNNIRTDLQVGDMQRLAEMAKNFDPKNVTNQVLDNTTNNLVRNSTIGGASVVVPVAGTGEYDDIQAYVRQLFVDGYIKSENASIQVENATGRTGMAVEVAQLLKTYGYNVIKTVPVENAAQTVIYDYTGGAKPYTIQYLQNRFGVTAEVVAPDPNAPPPSDIRIIVGGRL